MKICHINYDASHYRETIYRAIDETFDCDSVFGLPPDIGVKQMDTTGFKGKVIYTKIVTFGGTFYQKGIIPLIWKPYNIYLGLGETRGISTWLLPILIRVFKPKKKVYFWSHGWYGNESKSQRFMKRIFFRLPNGGTFVYGDHARDLMIKEGLPAEKIFVIHNSLAYPKQLKLRQEISPSSIYEEHFGNNNPVLIMIGRLNAGKHLDMLFYAVEKLKRSGHLYNIVLIGDGEEREKLKDLSITTGIENQVWFYGACYDEKDNAQLIYNADICVVPGNIGLTAIHSLMFGTPVISHDYVPSQGPEFEAIKPELTGAIFKHGDIDSLVHVIQNWSTNIKDRSAVRKACYNEVDSNWTPDYQIKVLKEHLKL